MGQGGTGTGNEIPGQAGTSAPVGGVVSRGGAGTGNEVPGGGVPAAASSSGGGFFGSLLHDVSGITHWTASKAGLAASDIKSMGTGLYGLGKLEYNALKYDFQHPNLGHHESLHDFLHGNNNPASHQVGQAEVGMAKNTIGTVEHPLRDPFMTVLTFAPIVGQAGRVGAGAAEAGAALRAGEGLGAAGKAILKPSLLSEPRLVNEPGREPVSLYSSHNAARRLVQKGIDSAVNRALANDNAKGLLGHEGPVASYGRYRMGGTLAERARAEIRYHSALIANTRMAGRAIGQFAKTVKGDVANPELTAQALLHALHDNALPEHEAIFHQIQAERGINPEQNHAWAQAFSDAAKLGVVHLGEDGRVAVNLDHPLAKPLAKADDALAKLGSYAENQLVARGLRDPGTLEDRKARVGQLVQRAQPLLGEEPQALREARRALAKAEVRHEKNLQADEAYMGNQGAKTVGGYRVSQGPYLTTSGKDIREGAGVVNETALRDRLSRAGFTDEEIARGLSTANQLRDLHARDPEKFGRYVGNSAKIANRKGIQAVYSAEVPQALSRQHAFATIVRQAYDETPKPITKIPNSNPYHDAIANSGVKLAEAQTRVQQLEDRYGLSSPERRSAIEQGIAAREQIAQAAHEHFGLEAPQHLARIEAFARHYARTNDVTPHEFYANFLHDGATDLHNVMGAVRESLAPGVAEIARRMYAPNGWDQAAEDRFVHDMTKAANGEPVSPEVQRLFTMTHEYIPGRGYVPMTVWENAVTSHAPMAAAPSPIVGEGKSPLNTHFATGEATAQGLRRTDVGESVTSHVQKLFRFFNTLDHRELAASHGSDTRLSTDDVLMRVDRRTEAGMKLPAQNVAPQLKETLGILENHTGLPEAEQEGLAAGVGAALKEVVGHVFPRYGNDPELRRIDETAARGDKAPAGYVWVPKQLARLKDLEAAVTRGEAGRPGRFMDNVNGAITAATVYFKVGHIFTRVLTNAATNLMQGSLRPDRMAESVKLMHALSPDEVTQALAYAGTHYYEAAPGATGGTVVAKSISKGLHIPFTDIALRAKSGEAVMSPQWWAHHVDAPFRFNSIAFEARQAGYEGATGFRQFLHDVQDYKLLDAEQRAAVDGVLRRADREAIAYDRLNQTEKRFVSRAIWFYPWVKGSTVFTANTFLEHPWKSFALGAAGHQGHQESQAALGDMPSYEQGLTPLTGGAEPVVTDLNTFNPFSTAADLMQIPSHLGNVAGMANPMYGAALNTARGENAYGVHTPTPIADNLKGLLSTTPEYQIANAALDHGDQSHRLFPGGHPGDPLYKNWLGELLRSLGGPATPRHVNPLAGHSLAQRERKGR